MSLEFLGKEFSDQDMNKACSVGKDYVNIKGRLADFLSHFKEKVDILETDVSTMTRSNFVEKQERMQKSIDALTLDMTNLAIKVGIMEKSQDDVEELKKNERENLVDTIASKAKLALLIAILIGIMSGVGILLFNSKSSGNTSAASSLFMAPLGFRKKWLEKIRIRLKTVDVLITCILKEFFHAVLFTRHYAWLTCLISTITLCSGLFYVTESYVTIYVVPGLSFLGFETAISRWTFFVFMGLLVHGLSYFFLFTGEHKLSKKDKMLKIRLKEETLEKNLKRKKLLLKKVAFTEQKERYARAIYESLSIPTFVIKHDLTILRANKAASSLLETGSLYLIGHKLHEFTFSTEDAKALINNQQARLLNVSAVESKVRVCLLSKVGRIKYSIVQIMPLIGYKEYLVTVNTLNLINFSENPVTQGTFSVPKIA